jgi:TonB family protein
MISTHLSDIFKERADKVAVLLKGVIQTDGHPVNIEIVRSGGVAFDEKALEAVRRWRFKPAKEPSGTPVSVVMPIGVTFYSPTFGPWRTRRGREDHR